MRQRLLLFCFLLLGSCETSVQTVTPAHALPAVDLTSTTPIRVATGQSIYVPVYSHIYTRDETSTFELTVTLSVRNTDAMRSITVTGVRYYDTDGNLLHIYVDRPTQLGALASVEYVVHEKDTRGGAGANFLVDWTAEQEVTEPVVEAVMIGTAQQQGISFISPGRVVGAHGPMVPPKGLPAQP